MSNPAASQQKILQRQFEHHCKNLEQKIRQGLDRRRFIGALAASTFIRGEFERLNREGHWFIGTNALDSTTINNPYFPLARALILEAEFSRALKREPEGASA